MKDLGHLNLSKHTRMEIAKQLSRKIPKEVVLEDIRNAASETEICRESLLTKQDVRNIERGFNINASHMFHSNDVISVEAFVEEDRLSPQSSVLYYKGQSTLCEKFSFLKEEDFLLIVMNESQGEILKKYGHDVVCMDSTHGIKYDFLLTSILVLGDLRQGFPCAFLISNRVDVKTLRVFIQYVAEKIGSLTPKVFMSDMDPALYNAWSDVMGVVEKQLFCTWHVLKAWETNIHQKVRGKEMKDMCSTRLRAILEETDENAFPTMRESFLSWCASNCGEFYTYFLRNYVGKEDKWAHCYRVRCGVNTNMHLERLHRTIKYFYLRGLANHRLDETIHLLMKFIRDRLYDRLVAVYKGKVTSKLAAIRSRHAESLKMSLETVVPFEENSWHVQSTAGPLMYKVMQMNASCNCRVKCTLCNICIHYYSCECKDSAVAWNICKHIHLLRRYLSDAPRDAEVNQEVTAEQDEHYTVDEKNVLAQGVINATKSSSNLTLRKQDLLRKISKIADLVNSVETPEEISEVERLLAPIEPSLAAMQKFRGRAVETISEQFPWQKKIVPQKRFFSTKKQCVKRKKSKPSNIEVTTVTNSFVIKEQNVTADN